MLNLCIPATAETVDTKTIHTATPIKLQQKINIIFFFYAYNIQYLHHCETNFEQVEEIQKTKIRRSASVGRRKLGKEAKTGEVKLPKRHHIGQLNHLGIKMSAKVNFEICLDGDNQNVEQAFSVPPMPVLQ